MAINSLQKHILLVVYMACGILDIGYSQFPGRPFEALRRNFRGPTSVTHGQSGGRGRGSPFSRGGNTIHSTTSNSRDTNNARSSFSNIQRMNRRLPFSHDQRRENSVSVTNSRPAFDRASPISFFRQNNFPNRTVYTTVNNNGIFNPQSRSFIPVTVQNVQNERSQNSLGSRTIATRGTLQSISPPRRTAIARGRPRSRERSVSLHQGRSVGSDTSFHTQTANNVAGRISQSSNANPVSGRRRMATPIQVPVSGNSVRLGFVPASAGTGSNIFQSRLAENSVDPRYRFRGLRNEAFQYSTSITRAPLSAGFVPRTLNDQRQYSGNPVQSLTLPFEPLSRRYQERMSERNERNFERQPLQSGVQFGGGSRLAQTGPRRRGPIQQTGTHVGRGRLQQIGLQFGSSSGRQISPFHDAGLRDPLQNVARQRRRFANRGNALANRNVQNTRQPLHEILGISTSGLQDAERTAVSENSRPTQTRPVSNNVQVVVRNGQRRQRVGSPDYAVVGRNSNDKIRTKANLIADIRRTLNFADRLNLFRQLSNIAHSTNARLQNNGERNTLSSRGSGITSRDGTVLRAGLRRNEDDPREDDSDDSHVRSGDDFSTQGEEFYANMRNDFSEDDDDDDENRMFTSRFTS